MVLKYLINLPVDVLFRDILTDTWKLINHMLLKLTLVKLKKIYIFSFLKSITVQRMNTPPMQLDDILTELSFLIKWLVVVYILTFRHVHILPPRGLFPHPVNSTDTKVESTNTKSNQTWSCRVRIERNSSFFGG